MEEESKVVDEEGKKTKKPLDLKKGGLIWTIWNATEATVLIVVGILAIVFSNNQDFQKTILAIIGSFLIVDGSLKILANFLPIVTNNKLEADAKAKARAAMAYDLVIGGAFELALGITLISIYASSDYSTIMPTLTSLISTFIAIICLVAGGALALFAIAFLIAKLYKVYMPIFELIFATALIALGIVILVYMGNSEQGSETFRQVVLVITGIIITLAGISMMINTFQAVAERQAAKKEAKQQATSENNGTAIMEAEVTIDATKKEEQRKDEGEKEEPKKDDPQKDEK